MKIIFSKSQAGKYGYLITIRVRPNGGFRVNFLVSIKNENSIQYIPYVYHVNNLNWTMLYLNLNNIGTDTPSFKVKVTNNNENKVGDIRSYIMNTNNTTLGYDDTSTPFTIGYSTAAQQVITEQFFPLPYVGKMSKIEVYDKEFTNDELNQYFLDNRSKYQ